MFADLIRLALGNLVRMKSRLVMTVTGVLIGSSTIILLVSIGLGMQKNAHESIGNLGDFTLLMVGLPIDFNPFEENAVQGAAAPAYLNDSTMDEISSFPGVTAITPRLHVKGFPLIKYRNLEASPAIFGIDPAAFSKFDLPLASGKTEIVPGQVVLGAHAMDYLFDPRQEEMVVETIDWQDAWLDLVLSRQVGEGGEYETKRLRVQVAGVLAETGGAVDHFGYVSLDEAERWNIWAEGKRIDRARLGYESIWVKVEDIEAAKGIEPRITELGLRVDTNRKFLEDLNQYFGFIQLMLGAIGGVALIVSAFGIANTMTMAIYERTREIGLLKSIGAKNADVILIFLTESGVIGLIGGTAGAAAAYGLGRLANSSGAMWTSRLTPAFAAPGSMPGVGGSMVLEMPVWLLVFAIGFSTLIGLVSGLIPATRAASLDPLTALRHE